MGEQVADRRAGRPGRFVEVDRPLFGRDQDGQCGDRLRHRSPTELPVARAFGREDLATSDDARRDVVGRPVLHLTQRVHGGGYLQWMERRRISSAMPMEQTYGYSRAVVAGDRVFVSGTAPVMPDGADPPPDAYGQTRRCLEIVLTALAEAGARPEDVVRTRIYLTRTEDIDEVGRAHGEAFGEIRPATTGIVVSALFDPRWLVEIEAEAIIAP
jgi:enamine deaminase RidA (YjgF/YER057c/UK114 family)